MRLGQLARKLDLRPIEIVEFLASKNIRIEEGTNTKVEDAHATLALQHFAPQLLQDDASEDEIQTIAAPEEPSEEEIVSSENTVTLIENPETETQPVPPEVIKAPKVALSGLKVLGKIELPEIKKKLPENEENVTDEPAKEFKSEKRNQNFKKQRRSAKNPIAMQREQEALAAQQKREEEIRLQKERRTQNYLKKVKAQQPTKAARLIKEQTEEMSAAELAEAPKTWWGKFKRWLTT